MTDNNGKDLLEWIGNVAKTLGLEENQTLVVKAVRKGEVLITSVFGNATIQGNWDRMVLGAEQNFNKPVIKGDSVIVPSEKYGSMDADSLMVLKHWGDHPPGNVLEVGANEEDLAGIFAEQGHNVVGIDLRPWSTPFKNYTRIEGDFVAIAPLLKPWIYDVAVSTSAIEHFGLNVYGSPVVEDYDARAMAAIYRLLRPGGACYLTVPYGSTFLENGHWRVYNHKTLQDRLICEFVIEKKIFFKSGGCACPDVEGVVEEKDADEWSGDPPHVTVFLKLRKL